MQTLESLKRRMDNAEDLHSIVRTMKTLAAVSVHQYERAVESLVEYHRTTELGLQIVLADQAQGSLSGEGKPREQAGVIVFGSDQGMCGQFNDQIAAYTIETLDNMGWTREQRVVIGVGIRAVSRLEEAGQAVESLLTIPGSVAGITPQVQRLLLLVESWQAGGLIDRVLLFYNQPLSGVAYRPVMERLLPIDLEQLRQMGAKEWPSRCLPIYTMERRQLLSALVRQHISVLLHRAFAESLASENVSRLASMQAAEKNIEERLAEIAALYHDQRQNTITSELLDIVSGFEVLTNPSAK